MTATNSLADALPLVAALAEELAFAMATDLMADQYRRPSPALELLAASPKGLRMTKEGLNLAVDAPSLEAAMAIENRNQLMTAASPNFAEGMRAFLEKLRTIVGWKGLINDPDIDKSFPIYNGLRVSRKLFCDLTSTSTPIASEKFDALSSSSESMISCVSRAPLHRASSWPKFSS